MTRKCWNGARFTIRRDENAEGKRGKYRDTDISRGLKHCWKNFHAIGCKNARSLEIFPVSWLCRPSISRSRFTKLCSSSRLQISLVVPCLLYCLSSLIVILIPWKFMHPLPTFPYPRLAGLYSPRTLHWGRSTDRSIHFYQSGNNISRTFEGWSVVSRWYNFFFYSVINSNNKFF